MPDRESMVETVKAYCRTQTAKDRKAWMALFADNIVHEDPVGYATRCGLDELGSLWEMAVESDVKLDLTADVIVCGNEAIGIMAAETGPHDARRQIAPIIDHFVFDDAGKITNLRAFYKFD